MRRPSQLLASVLAPARAAALRLGLPLVALVALVAAGGVMVSPSVARAVPDEERVLDDTKLYRMPVDGAPFRGPRHARVTIVAFTDFECPFCAKAARTLEELRRRYPHDVKIVLRHLPLAFHKNAMLAAEAAMAAHAQGKLWPLHDAMFLNQRSLDRAGIERLASGLRLDMKRFREDLDTGRWKTRVLEDMALAARFGATATPTFFVNGRPLRGAQPLEAFELAVQANLRAADEVIARGTPRPQVYQALTKDGITEAPPRPGDPSAIGAEREAVPVDGAASRGPGDAPVTIVAFADFECVFCARSLDSLRRLEREHPGDVRFVFRHLPLRFHPHAELASRAAIAAGAQGRFWEMHDLLFANQKALARADLEGYARRLRLDLGRFRAALDDPRTARTVREDLALASELDITGTPTYFVNGRRIKGAQPYATFALAVEEEREHAAGLLARGTRRDRLYATVVGLGGPRVEARRTLRALAACQAGDAERAAELYAGLKGARRRFVRTDCKAFGVALPR